MWLLPIAAMAGLVAWVESSRDSFLDDAFLYLAVARNVVETGCAEIFPVADGEALITSSPLRLLLLLVGQGVAAIVFGGQPSLESARAVLLVTGLATLVLGCAVTKARGERVVACAVAGVLALTTHSMLQMEGALLFWLVFLLVRELDADAFSWRAALLCCLLAMARVEFGVAALPALLLVHRRHLRPVLWRLGIVGAAAATAWSIAAAAMGVWPIPTTFLSKVATGEAHLFGPRFLQVAHETMGSYLPVPAQHTTGRLTLALLFAALVWSLWQRRGGRFAAGMLLTVLVLLARAPGNFSWYHENVLIAAIAALLGVAGTTVSTRHPGRAALALGAMLSCFVVTRVGHNDELAWRVGEPGSYGDHLRRLASHHVGDGRFQFDDDCLLATWEIGIVAYFAGPSCWLYDRAGVAQPGQLERATASSLARFYPDRVLRSGDDELAIVRRRVGELPLCEVRFDPALDGDGPRMRVVPFH